MNMVLDHGGPMRVWDDDDDVIGPRTGIDLDILFCDRRECPAAHLEARTVWVAEPAGPDGADDAGLVHGPMRRVTVDVDTERLTIDGDPEEGRWDDDLLERLKARIFSRDGVLPVLRKRWRRARGVKQDAWRARDWSSWEPGQLVSWLDVHPDDPNLLFDSNGEPFWADDHYCITAGCSCRDVRLQLWRTQKRVLEPVAAIVMDLDRWATCDADGGGPLNDLQARLWADLQRSHPDLREEVLQRSVNLRRIAPEIRALAGGAEPPAPVSTKHTGRNDPCPCGSGRKYKRCCIDA